VKKQSKEKAQAIKETVLNLHSSCESLNLHLKRFFFLSYFPFASSVLFCFHRLLPLQHKHELVEHQKADVQVREINNNLCPSLDMNIQCTIYYPVVAATRVCLSIHASLTQNMVVIAIQSVMGLRGVIFSTMLFAPPAFSYQ
jgi:hypothetical protein